MLIMKILDKLGNRLTAVAITNNNTVYSLGLVASLATLGNGKR